MDQINLNIGHHLKDIRNKRGLSLDEVSRLTDVSKAMLGQIERGKSVPTVSTLWKISTGLKVSFSAFMEDAQQSYKVIDQYDIIPIIEENEKMRLYPIFPFDVNQCFEILTIELEPECSHKSTPHNENVEEYIIVTEGQLEISVSEETFSLKKGNSMRFMADRPHSYINHSGSRTTFQNIILYKK